MDKKIEAQPKKRGLLALLKESLKKTSEGCGPGCGCHADGEKENAKDSVTTKDNKNK